MHQNYSTMYLYFPIFIHHCTLNDDGDNFINSITSSRITTAKPIRICLLSVWS